MAASIFTQDQETLIAMTKEWADAEVKPFAGEWDEKGICPIETIRSGFEIGFHSMSFPEEYGGLGLDTQTVCMILEELAKADAGVACAFGVTGTASLPVMKFGTEEQKALYAKMFEKGGLASFCLTEPEAGSDSGSVRMSAVKKGDQYILNGTKCFITNGGYADLYFVVASTDRSKGNRGLSGFIVPKGTKGLTIGKEENKCGFRTSNTVELVFEDVSVPEEYLVGKEGDGFKQAMAALDHGRPFIAAVAVGIAQRALDEAAAYAKVRKQFGKPIAENQAIRFMLADMEIKTEASRALVQKTAALLDAGKRAGSNGSITKCFATDAAVQVALDAVQILGGYGYMKEYPVEKLMRDAKIFQIVEGTNQVQRIIIANEVLK